MSIIPEGYRHKTEVEVRFADIDALGHVNNAVYLTYVEQARILYLKDVCKWGGSWQDFGIILAHAEVDYKQKIEFGDTPLIYTRVGRIGGKSFDLEYVIIRQRPNEPDIISATAKTVLVMYDYAKKETMGIPDEWRKMITDYEPILTVS